MSPRVGRARRRAPKGYHATLGRNRLKIGLFTDLRILGGPAARGGRAGRASADRVTTRLKQAVFLFYRDHPTTPHNPAGPQPARNMPTPPKLAAAVLFSQLSCAAAFQLPASALRRSPQFRRSSSISCAMTDEEWAKRWPGKTPEEIENMKKWCGFMPTHSCVIAPFTPSPAARAQGQDPEQRRYVR